MRKKLFGNNIPPACEYCDYGKETADGEMILCGKCGLVKPFYSCKKFKYNPLKRIPKPVKPLPKYQKGDFEI